MGYRHPRLRGDAYDEFIEEFVEAVNLVFPHALLQWEDFKQHNAIRILDRYRNRITSFNDDIQGTGAVVLAGVLAACRAVGKPLGEQRFVFLGSGAAGIGIARTIRAAMRAARVDDATIRKAIVTADTQGLIFSTRDQLDRDKLEFALGPEQLAAYGLGDVKPSDRLDFDAIVAAVRPTMLIGTSGVPGAFTEKAVRDMAAQNDRPVFFPLSNPTASSEATPADLLAWTDGRALVATGSPFEPVTVDGRTHTVGQANNVFIFPGMGLGGGVVGMNLSLIHI